MHFVLSYELKPDYLARRAAFRAEHLTLARAAVLRGELLLGGALSEPTDRALLVFTGPGPERALAFAHADPYVREGLVERFRVQPWTTVVGAEAAARLPEESPPDQASSARIEQLIAFLRGAHHGVVATVAQDGGPQAATVGVAVSDRLELVFDTSAAARKAINLRAHPRVAVVLTRGAATAQIQGLADEPTGAELERVRSCYFEAFPDGVARAAWPDITWFRVRPDWIRTTDFGTDPPTIVTWNELT